jgi:hypothetical protein
VVADRSSSSQPIPIAVASSILDDQDDEDDSPKFAARSCIRDDDNARRRM